MTVPPRLMEQELFGIEPVEIRADAVRWGYTVRPEHMNTQGVLHGGIAMALLDTALGHAVWQRLRDEGVDAGNLAVQINVNFVRAVRAGRLACEARVVSLGRRIAVAEGVVTDEAGELVARGSATHAILPRTPAG